MTGLTKTAVLMGVLALLPAAASAQDPDEQTQDYEEQDRRYYERYLREREAAKEEEPEEEAEPEADPLGEAIAAFLARAEDLVKDQNYWSRSTDLYRVQTDDPNLDSKAVLVLLDSFRGFFDEFWSGRLELTPYEQQSRLFLFDSFYKYNELLGFDARRMPVRPEGHYISVINVMVINTRAGSPEGFANTLVHESAHQLVDQIILGGAIDGMPVWLSEGLASYFGYTYRDKTGEFQAGRIGGKSIAVMKNTPAGRDPEGAQRVKALRSAMKSPEQREQVIERLLKGGPESFYGEDVLINYGAAWMLVHFLLHGEDGRHAEGFARYIEGMAAGTGDSEALLEQLGVTAGELQDAFVAYVKKVKTG